MRRSSSLHGIDTIVERNVSNDKYAEVVAVGQNIEDIVSIAANLDTILTTSSDHTLLTNIGTLTHEQLETAIALNTAKVSNIDHPLVETAVPLGAVFTDTDTVYTHPTTDGNIHLPANGTLNAGKVPTATAVAGVYTLETPIDTNTTYTNVSEFINDAGYLTAETSYPADALVAQDITNIQNLSGTNTGDQDLSSYDTHIGDATKHRLINDVGTLTTELFSASKIIAELGGKSDTSHNHTGVYEPADTTILKDADIGVTLQAYDATLEVGAEVNTINSDITGIPGAIVIPNIVQITQANYDLLTTPETTYPNVLFVIVG